MSNERIPRLGSWNETGNTQTAGTAIVIGIRPWRGGTGAPLLYAVDASKGPNWNKPGAVTHVAKLGLLTGSTAHSIIVMKPKNWALTSVASLKNTTAMALVTDPGLYSTNFKYPSNLGTGTAAVADNALAASDYVAFQLTDGSWVFDTVASGTFSAIVLTTTLPNITGGGVAAGTPVFFFGISTDKNPNTGAVDPTIQPNVSVYSDVSDADNGISSAIFPGDPLIAYDGNGTAADTIGVLSGFYGKY